MCLPASVQTLESCQCSRVPTVPRGVRPDSSGGVKAISDPQNGLAEGHCYIVFNGRIYTGEVAVPCSNGRVKFNALHVSPGSRTRCSPCTRVFQVWRYPPHSVTDAQIMTATMPPPGKQQLQLSAGLAVLRKIVLGSRQRGAVISWRESFQSKQAPFCTITPSCCPVAAASTPSLGTHSFGDRHSTCVC